ncbi:uncharacterized protein GGS22DRAFT_192770 [Annulohypoxylon maeteangense]|uniref:uncharacterized protein n=1 Tax=Annulohypoxylon maeteangense TaxID=1927788 RepID=UPI002007AF0E|nr:uncharacterized protein GGS22DRAFT_192770 [Annulohypoxylon maeteangense]KAI0880933.1 hypothetical protein GGS22DRAFT_192770 [Annulohypoxylon maeteangense]
MSKLPPVEKLPLALRKNIRDAWDNKKSGFEQQISDILTVPWTIDINPNQLFAYAEEGYAKESLGDCIASYINGAIYKLKDYVSSGGDEGLKELNSICHAHTITMDLDDANRVTYCGADVHEGKLRILFAPSRLGTNIDDALSREVLLKALNEAPAPESDGAVTLSFAARKGIRDEYENRAEEIRSQIGKILEKPDIKLTPNFEDTFTKLQQESKADSGFRSDWESILGSFTLFYWEGLINQLKSQKFDQDDLLREGFHEAVEKGEIAFRIVEKLKYSSYCECDIEDGVLYLQCTSKTWGSNIDDAAQGLLDRL